MLGYKQKRNNGRTPFAGVCKFVCGRVRHRLWGTCNNRTMVPHKEIQWHNGTGIPHKRNSKIWPGLVTKEKTIKYPTSAMCTVYMCVCVGGGGGGRVGVCDAHVQMDVICSSFR